LPLEALRIARIVTRVDLDGNGTLDLVATSGHVLVRLGVGDGIFQDAVSYGPPSSGALQLADVTGDGKLDVVTSVEMLGLSILPGNGDGTFQPALEYANPSASIAIAVR